MPPRPGCAPTVSRPSWSSRYAACPWTICAYGGIQIHVEDLAAYLAGRDRCDAAARWAELLPAYEDLAAKVS